MSRKQTSKAEFRRFVNECKRLIPVLNLGDWSIYFEHKKGNGAYAYTKATARDRVATIVFSSDRYQELDIITTARHEMLHLLLSTYEELALRRKRPDNYVLSMENERIVVVLEKVIR